MTSMLENRKWSQRAGGARRAGRLAEAAGRAFTRAFTLVEVLIAVGAVALIGVAIAAVFDQTGRTVTVGRRVSAMNAYAGTIERQLRADFARITRDGFMVIHNQLADPDRVAGFSPTADLVPLHADDLSPRPRRTDEIMFFIKGDFTTAREPLHEENVARGNAARVYYGHGKRRIVDTTSTTTFYMQPRLDDDMSAPAGQNGEFNLGVVPTGAIVNPNRYASDWTLLRHQAVLATPRNTIVTMSPGYLPPGVVREDRDEQIAFQPAASNLFRALSTRFPAGGQVPLAQPGQGLRSGEGRPHLASGLVDIVTTSLPEIRAIVLTADVYPGPAVPLTFFDPQSNDQRDGDNDGVDGKWRPYFDPPGTEYDNLVIERMQAWMQDALPANSHAPQPDQRTRMRYEPTPPNFLGSLQAPVPIPGGYPLEIVTEMRRADQVMLGSSSFIPRCTEFIVEWSFGKVYPSDSTSPLYAPGREGEMIWHGMERLPNGTPPQTVPNTQSVVWPYDENENFERRGRVMRLERRYPRIDGIDALDNTRLFPFPPPAAAPAPPYPAPNNQYVQSFLVHDFGVPVGNLAPGDPLFSYFGYADPTFIPDKDGNRKIQPPARDWAYSATGVPTPYVDSATPTLPWPWPKLVRVTIGLGDPTDPSFEQRFQFVFELPGNPE